MDETDYTLKQKVFLYDSYIKSSSSKKCQKKFKAEYPGIPVPRRSYIEKLIKRVKKTGSLLDTKKSSGKKSNSKKKKGGKKSANKNAESNLEIKSEIDLDIEIKTERTSDTEDKMSEDANSSLPDIDENPVIKKEQEDFEESNDSDTSPNQELEAVFVKEEIES